MSTFNVRLSDGSEVEVSANSAQEAAAAARKYEGGKKAPSKALPKKPPAPPKKPQGLLGRAWEGYKDWADDRAHEVAGFTREAIDQVLPNWGDEIYAAPRAVKAAVTGKSPSKAFKQAQRDYKKQKEDFSKTDPGLSTSGKVTGVLGSIFLPAGKVVRGATTAQKARQGAAWAGAYGTVAGAGEGEGLDVERRASNAVQSGTTAAAFGAAIPVGLQASQDVGRLAREYIPGVDPAARGLSNLGRSQADKLARLLPPSLRRKASRQPELPSAVTQRAYRDVLAQMNAGHIDAGPGLSGVAATPQAIGAELSRRNALGVPAMVGDVSPAMRSLSASASRGAGPGQTMVREALASRKATEGARVDRYIRDALPSVPDPITYVDDVRRQAREAAAPLYREAYSQPLYRTREMQGIEQTPAFQEALPQAYRNIRNQIDEATGLPKDPHGMGFRAMDADPNGLPPNTPYFELPDGQFVTVGEGLTVEGYDQVIRAMRDAGEQAAGRNPVTGQIENNTNSVHINSRARELRDHLGSQNSPYAQAVGQYADGMSQANAFRQGQNVAKLTGPDIAAQGRELPEAAQEAWATGAGTAIADEASRYTARHPYGDVAGRASAMLGDDAKRAALSDITGQPEGLRRLQDALEFERQATANWRSSAKHGSFEGYGVEMPTLSPTGIPQRIIGAIAERAGRATRGDYDQRIADLVTSRDPEVIDDIVRTMNDVTLARQARRDRLQRQALTAAGLVARNIEPVDPVSDEYEYSYDGEY